MNNKFEIGIIAGGHGLKGELKVYPYTDDPANLLKSKLFYFKDREWKPVSLKQSGKFIVIGFNEIKSREEADAMKGISLFIDKEDATPLKDGAFYIRDLIGCEVFENKVLLGVLEDVLQTGANDVYSVISESGNEILIPAIKSVVKSIDIEDRKIEVELIEGLVENIDF